MACPDAARYTADSFQAAIENMSLWDAAFCPYATPLGELAVGSIVYSAFALNIFIRTGSMMIPFILVLILGGTILAQVYAVIGTIAGAVILISAPLIISGIVFLIDRSG